MGKRISQRELREVRHTENVLHSYAKREGKKIAGFRHTAWSDGCVTASPIYEEGKVDPQEVLKSRRPKRHEGQISMDEYLSRRYGV